MAENYTADERGAGRGPRALAGLRLDQALVRMFPQYSRNRLQAWLKSGHVLVDGKPSGRNAKTAGGEEILLRPPPAADASMPPAQRLPLKVVFEDDDLIVIDKPAGLVVHPGAGNPDNTLLNALLAHAPSLRAVPRAGIVHRLDKDTTGLLVVAKNLAAQAHLAAQLAARSVKRTYLALVHGAPPAHGAIDAPVGRDTRARTRMAVTHRGKEARTSYRVLERFAQGRMRRHWSNAGSRPAARTRSASTCSTSATRWWAIRSTAAAPAAASSSRARRCTPRNWNSCIRARGRSKAWKAPLPADMKKLLARLRRAG